MYVGYRYGQTEIYYTTLYIQQIDLFHFITVCSTFRTNIYNDAMRCIENKNHRLDCSFIRNHDNSYNNNNNNASKERKKGYPSFAFIIIAIIYYFSVQSCVLCAASYKPRVLSLRFNAFFAILAVSLRMYHYYMHIKYAYSIRLRYRERERERERGRKKERE